MAKGQQNSNREKRKPKAAKPAPVAAASPFARVPGATAPKGNAGKKAR